MRRPPEFDTNAYKAEQRRDWNAVAPGWQKWWPVLEAGGGEVTRQLLAMAELQPGDRVLDVATGIGEPALSAAIEVGPRGRVVAVDQSSAMLDIARARARQAGQDNIEFIESDTEQLDLPHYTFDRVLSRWGLMFLPNLVDALGRMQRLLAPGGKLAGVVWGAPQAVPSISLAMGVVGRALNLAPPPPGLPGPFRLADPEELEDTLIDAGFVEFHCRSIPVTFELPSAEAYAELTRDIAAPITALLAAHPPAVQREVWRRVMAAAREYAGADGIVRMRNESICFVAW